MNATTTTIRTAAADLAQPWWTRHNATYGAVYYARTLAKIARAARVTA